MRAGASVRVAYNKLPAIGQTFEARVAEAINGCIADFVDAASQTIPRDTGTMAATMMIEEAAPGRLSGSVGYGQEYAVHVHEGTVRQRAQPWAREIADAMEGDYVAAIRRQMIEGV